MKRMCPRPHLSIDKSSTNAQSRNVNVMIDQSLRIYIVESALDQVRRFRAELVRQLFRSLREGTANGMNETHFVYDKQIIVPSIVAINVALFRLVQSKNIRANYRQRLSTLNNFSRRQKHFAFCRTQQVHFELDTEHFRIWRHQTVRRIATSRVSDRSNDAGVQIAMLLGQIGAIRKRDLNHARLDASQLRSDQSHDRLFGEALFDLFREGGITWLDVSTGFTGFSGIHKISKRGRCAVDQ